jgi:hypothetical protein
MPFGIDLKSSTGANIQKIADLNEFLQFSKREGYLRKNASLAEAKELIKTWKKTHKIKYDMSR